MMAPSRLRARLPPNMTLPRVEKESEASNSSSSRPSGGRETLRGQKGMVVEGWGLVSRRGRRWVGAGAGCDCDRGELSWKGPLFQREESRFWALGAATGAAPAPAPAPAPGAAPGPAPIPLIPALVGATPASSAAASGAGEPRTRGACAPACAARIGGFARVGGFGAETLAPEVEPNKGLVGVGCWLVVLLIPPRLNLFLLFSPSPSPQPGSNDTDRRLKLLARFLRGDKLVVAGIGTRVTDMERVCRVAAGRSDAGLGRAPGSDMMVSELVGRSS